MKNKIIKSLALVFLALTIVTNGVHMPGTELLWRETSNCTLSDEGEPPVKEENYPYI